MSTILFQYASFEFELLLLVLVKLFEMNNLLCLQYNGEDLNEALEALEDEMVEVDVV